MERYFIHDRNRNIYYGCLLELSLMFVYVEVLWPNQLNGVISRAVSLPNHNFTGQAWSSKWLTSIMINHSSSNTSGLFTMADLN